MLNLIINSYFKDLCSLNERIVLLSVVGDSAWEQSKQQSLWNDGASTFTDAALVLLRTTSVGGFCLRAPQTWMHVDAGLDRLHRWSRHPGKSGKGWCVYFTHTQHGSVAAHPSVFFQCQWTHIGGFLHPRTAAPFRIPGDAFWPVLAANLLYGVTPLLVALRVYSNHYFFLKIAPFPGQTGLPNSEEKDTKYKDK